MININLRWYNGFLDHNYNYKYFVSFSNSVSVMDCNFEWFWVINLLLLFLRINCVSSIDWNSVNEIGIRVQTWKGIFESHKDFLERVRRKFLKSNRMDSTTPFVVSGNRRHFVYNNSGAGILGIELNNKCGGKFFENNMKFNVPFNDGCVMATRAEFCNLPYHCKHTFVERKNNLTLCYGYKNFVYKPGTFASSVQGFVDPFSSYFCTNDSVVSVPDATLRLNSIDFHKPDFNLDDSVTYTYRLGADWNKVLYDAFVRKLNFYFIGDTPFKYVCDDDLWNEGVSMIRDYNIFPSKISCPGSFEYYSPNHSVCFQLLFSGKDLCPNSVFGTFVPFKFVTRDVPIVSMGQSVKDFIDYFILNFKVKLEMGNVTMNALDYNKFFELFNATVNGVDYASYFEMQNKTNFAAVELFYDLFSRDTKPANGTYGNFIADALGYLIHPFVEAIKDMLLSYWRLISPLVSELLVDVVKATIELLTVLTDLLSSIVDNLSGQLNLLIDLFMRLLKIVSRVITSLLLLLECDFYVVEMIITFSFLTYYLHSNVAALLILNIFVLVTGVQRRYPSLLLELVNSEFSFNITCNNTWQTFTF